MKRRDFLKGAGAGAVAGAGLTMAPLAGAANLPRLRWRMVTSWPNSLDTIYGGAEDVAKYVSQLTGGRFRIRPYAGGELVGGLQVLDAVSADTVEMGHTASYYYIGKSPALAFDCTVPFGMTTRQQNAWQMQGGGNELLNKEVFSQFGIMSLPAGNTGVQMGGWFRKPVPDLKSLQGLKMRIPGFGGKVMAKLGVNVQTLAGAEIYPALERGVIDAAEFVGPYDDQKLGFYQVAKYYYAPSWWEPNAQLSVYINNKRWASLPRQYQDALRIACAAANWNMVAKYDAKNPPALKSLMSKGVKLEKFSNDIMTAAQKAAFEIYDGLNQTDPTWRKIYGEWLKFRNMEFAWAAADQLVYESFAFPQVPLKDL
ncbi:TRAP transporter substrate-binding protein [Acidihalobacter ferrooxydans]|uniref:ABC transporter substrate-binding protein n=1 Tax=Acidihalobacter ferrooxydans TaxID=1765967 RepID=A0A1P8UK97_9GAMM|nr:TRAP transporter substrate-binding protein DctP [Acidihalobacter ferrooxydans]APZ44266.1 ABC transporter substrate-binding protein [Acidihalobacter ferrooxydans]